MIFWVNVPPSEWVRSAPRRCCCPATVPKGDRRQFSYSANLADAGCHCNCLAGKAIGSQAIGGGGVPQCHAQIRWNGEPPYRHHCSYFSLEAQFLAQFAPQRISSHLGCAPSNAAPRPTSTSLKHNTAPAQPPAQLSPLLHARNYMSP